MSAAPTRVLFVHSSAGRYGADRQLELLVRTLDRDRVEPLVLLPFDGPLGDDLRAAGAEVFTGPLPVLRRELLSPGGLARLARQVSHAQPALLRLLTARRIDVVHANTSVVLGLRRPATHAGAALVTHVREIYPPVPAAWPAHRRALLTSDAVVCVSEGTRAAFGGGDPRVCVIHDGLAIEPRRAARREARLALGLPRDAFVVAVIGRISGWKGQEVLARAVTDVRLLPLDPVALVAGDAWPGQEGWEERLRGYGERVRLVGFRDDIETVYGAADVVAVPSTSPDPLPNSALEAAAAGCCVVAAAHGGLPEIVRDGETGRLVTPGDHRELASVLAELAADPAERERLGDAAATDVRARFAPAKLARSLQTLYDEVT